MDLAEARKSIDEFEAHYRYDSTYMRELLQHSHDAYEKFANFLPLARHREKLGCDEYWLAKLAAMQVQDCGDCLQLNVRMALEDGVSAALIEAALQGGYTLPEHLKDVYLFAKHIASNEIVIMDVMKRIEARYDKGALLELGLCIASAAVFPTLRRTLGYTRSCKLMEIEL